MCASGGVRRTDVYEWKTEYTKQSGPATSEPQSEDQESPANALATKKTKRESLRRTSEALVLCVRCAGDRNAGVRKKPGDRTRKCIAANFVNTLYLPILKMPAE